MQVVFLNLYLNLKVLYLTCYSQMIVNMGVIDKKATNKTRISKVDTTNGNCIQEILPDSECRTAVLSNLYVSQGETGKVRK